MPLLQTKNSNNMRLIALLYTLLRPYSRRLLAGSLLLAVFCVVVSSTLVVREDITFLLPTRPEALAEQFFFLREAPFTQGLTITVSGENPAHLADTLAEALRGHAVPRVFGGGTISFSPEMLTRLCAASPGLMEPEQVAMLPDLVQEDAMRRALVKDARLLQTPKGLALRELLAMDPLAICGRTLQRLAPAKGSGPRLESGHLVSKDGKHALLFAEPATPIGDSNASREVMSAVRAAIKTLPPDTTALVAGGHRHTEENANVIMRDVSYIIPISLILFAAAYLVFVRTVQGLSIFLLPGVALIIASACVGLFYGSLSGIVIGFGSVILGITSDYAIHVYFAIRNGTNVARSLERVSKPLLVGAGTTLVAFVAFLFSDIPCITQMAVFSVSGIVAAVLLALVVLPHFLDAKKGRQLRASQMKRECAIRRAPLAAVWLILLIVLVVLFREVPVNGDVRALSYVSEAITADETRTRELWGGLRESAMMAVRGNTLEEALSKNDAVWEALGKASHKGDFDRSRITGLGGILPAISTQTARHEAWKTFWREHGPNTVARLGTLGAEVGFAPGAFAAFADWITAEPALMHPETLEGIGLILPLQLARKTEKGSIVYSLVPPDIPSAVLAVLAEKGATFIAGHTFRDALASATRSDMVRFGCFSLLGVVFMVAVALRSPWRVALALLPIAVGLGSVLAVYQIFDLSLNIFHAIALPLVVALSVDYGVFILANLEGTLEAESRKGVILSGLTTLSSFGVLLLAIHPALHSLGLTVVLGLTAALVTALYLVPYFAESAASVDATPRGLSHG